MKHNYSPLQKNIIHAFQWVADESGVEVDDTEAHFFRLVDRNVPTLAAEAATIEWAYAQSLIEKAIDVAQAGYEKNLGDGVEVKSDLIGYMRKRHEEMTVSARANRS